MNRPLAVVTGASSGIGLELARQFARNGFDLLITAEDGGLGDAARSLEGEGASVRTVTADLASADGVEALYARIRSVGRPVDAIAFNAGVGVGGPFLETDLEGELNLIRLNVISTVHLAKRVLPDMVARGEGRVLFTASIAALIPGAFAAVYNASKAFVHSFAEAVRNELKDTGVTVTALLAAETETRFFERAGMADTPVGRSRKADPADIARAGYDAMRKGTDHVIAPFTAKVRAALTSVLPRTMITAMARPQ